MDKLISSILIFLLSLVPSFLTPQFNKITNNETTIIFTGDVMLGRSVMGKVLDSNDKYYPFRKTADFLKNVDIAFVNLENPIVSNCPRVEGGFKFCTTPAIAKSLSFAGIDIVNLANNHVGNYGKLGFEETKKYLIEDQIKYVGDGNLEILEKNNIKFGFLGFNYTFGDNTLDSDIDLISKSDSQVDVLIIENHWGNEYHNTANTFQIETAHKMIDKGADVIIGNHPHWVQNYEEYKDKPIYYSLGNFIFDQDWSEETKNGLVVKMTFTGSDLTRRDEFKIYSSKTGQPEFITESLMK